MARYDRAAMDRRAAYVRSYLVTNLSVPDVLDFDVELAVRRLGGTLALSAMSGIDAEASVEKTGLASFAITIQRDVHPTRKKFSIAHELGHLFVHMGYLEPGWHSTGDYLDSARYRVQGNFSVEELEANHFAGALLMPESKFREVALDHHNPDRKTYSLGPIARAFGVSIDAARQRGRILNLFSWS